MKFLIATLIAILSVASGGIASAGLTVIDPTLIATNREASAKQLLELILQEQNQQVSIQLFEEFLTRHGSLEEPLSPSTFDKLLSLFERLPDHLSRETTDERTDETTVFSEPPSPVHEATDPNVKVGDAFIGELNGENFRGEAAARSSLNRFQTVRDEAIERKRILMKSLEEATFALAKATTVAEVQKLNGLILSLNTQLAVIENDLTLANQDATSRMLQNRNEQAVEVKRARQAEKLKFRHAHQRNLELFKLTK